MRFANTGQRLLDFDNGHLVFNLDSLNYLLEGEKGEGEKEKGGKLEAIR